MPVQALLTQVSIEYETLQSKYDKAVLEINTLRDRLEGLAEDTYATAICSPQRHFATEANHSTRPSEDSNTMREQTSMFGGTAKLPPKRFSLEDTNKTRQSAHERNAGFMQVTMTTSQDYVDPDSCKGQAREILGNNYFEMLIGIVVVGNIVVMWIEADLRANGDKMPTWILVINVIYFVVYCIEFAIRVLAFGVQVFAEIWNRLDFAIIMIDVVTVLVRFILGGLSGDAQMGGAKMLRLFRLFRLARIVKILRFNSEIQLLIHGFAGAVKALVCASGMLGIVIILWSFVYVETIEPYVKEMTEQGIFDSCSDCPLSYSSMWLSCLTLMQKNVAGDSWGKVNLEVIREYPETSPVFIASLATILLGIMNLILTVIVDAAARSKEEATSYILEQKELKFLKIKEKLIQMMRAMDHDQSGELTYDELKQGFETNKDFGDTMASMDITLEDLSAVFMIMDEDRSGTVTYTEFVNNLYKLKQQDTDTTLFFIKGYVYDIRFKVRNDLKQMIENLAKDTAKTQQHVEEMFGIVLEHVDAMKDITVPKPDRQQSLPDIEPSQPASIQQPSLPNLGIPQTKEEGVGIEDNDSMPVSSV